MATHTDEDAGRVEVTVHGRRILEFPFYDDESFARAKARAEGAAYGIRAFAARAA